MRLDNAGYVGHTAVSFLNRVPVEYFFGKVFVDEFEETFADVGSDILTVWLGLTK